MVQDGVDLVKQAEAELLTSVFMWPESCRKSRVYKDAENGPLQNLSLAVFGVWKWVAQLFLTQTNLSYSVTFSWLFHTV